MKLAYLAGAIDQVSTDESHGWREHWAEQLLPLGIGSYSPVHAWQTDPTQMTRRDMGIVCRVNRAALEQCDLFLCNHDILPVWGTIRELEAAAQHRKPLYIVSAVGIPSYEAWDLNVSRTFEELLAKLTSRPQQSVHSITEPHQGGEDAR